MKKDEFSELYDCCMQVVKEQGRIVKNELFDKREKFAHCK